MLRAPLLRLLLTVHLPFAVVYVPFVAEAAGVYYIRIAAGAAYALSVARGAVFGAPSTTARKRSLIEALSQSMAG